MCIVPAHSISTSFALSTPIATVSLPINAVVSLHARTELSMRYNNDNAEV
jgi:hypothetical protein